MFEAVWQGQTPGKRIIGLRVIHASGRPVSTGEAILRNIVRIADQLPGIYAIGIVSVFLTARSQRLGDLAAGTVVVHERPVEGVLDAIHEASAAVGGATRYGAGRLTPEEVAVIDLYFSRRKQLDGHARVRAARQIATRIRDRLAITEGNDDEQLLEDVAAEYRTTSRFR